MPTETADADAAWPVTAVAAEPETSEKLVAWAAPSMLPSRHCIGLARASEPYALPFHWRERPSARSLESFRPHARLLVTLTVCSDDVALVPGVSAGQAYALGKLAVSCGISLSAIVCAT